MDDLSNFVPDPATLIVAFDRVAGNTGGPNHRAWTASPSPSRRGDSSPRVLGRIGWFFRWAGHQVPARILPGAPYLVGQGMVLQVGADLLHDLGRQATAALGVDPGADAHREQAGHRHRATLRGDRQPGPGLPQAIPSRQHRRGKRPEHDGAVGFHLDSTTDGRTIKIASITGERT
jgi:hypothetical protein